jgi:hypothetical protein
MKIGEWPLRHSIAPGCGSVASFAIFLPIRRTVFADTLSVSCSYKTSLVALAARAPLYVSSELVATGFAANRWGFALHIFFPT